MFCMVEHLRKCRVCEEIKAVETGFHRAGNKGWRDECKACFNAYQRERWASGRVDKVKVYARDKAWRDANPDKTRVINRRAFLKRRFGVTPEWYEQKLASQGGCCAICKNAVSGDSRFDTFSIDHDHVTGAIRGLLCHSCNTTLGHANDDPERLVQMAEYLLRYRDVLNSGGTSA